MTTFQKNPPPPPKNALIRTGGSVIGSFIDAITWEEAITRISAWSAARESRYVCICNSHSVVTSQQDADFSRVIAQADMATPDGAPVAWMLRRLGFNEQQRINGPDLMLKYCERAASCNESIFLYGGSPDTLRILQTKLPELFPGLKIAGAISPPFRALSSEEDAEFVRKINVSTAGTVWVSLGCPKQEKWMAAHRGQINAVMLGVGAAFDYHAGTIKRAPLWMRNLGLEWFYRLLSEPRRLYKRYIVTNSFFIILAAKQLFTFRRRQ
jgi:N-acetylglucosaminyldiphosphoundecaprenol N-acetyl-beta-D-mannosaminyltransferase